MSPTKVFEITEGDNMQNYSNVHDLLTSVKPCKLPPDVQQVAYQELREDENTRKQCLLSFRQWIYQNPDIQNIIMDDEFLLRFLRTKKFSLPMAQQMLLKYLNLRQKFPMYLMNLDCLDPAVNELIDSGYLYVSPFRDNHGRRVIIGSAKNFDLQNFTNKDLAHTHLITYETLMNDEVNQVMGYTHVGDLTSISPAYLTLFTPTEFATLVKWGEQSFPMRHKALHMVNVPTPVKFAYDFFLTRVSAKIHGRVKMYNSISELHEVLDKKVLPKEMGGEMPMAEMIALWKKEIMANREKFLALDKMRLLSDRNIITRRKAKLAESYGVATGFNQLNGSFRKLEVD